VFKLFRKSCVQYEVERAQARMCNSPAVPFMGDHSDPAADESPLLVTPNPLSYIYLKRLNKTKDVRSSPSKKLQAIINNL